MNKKYAFAFLSGFALAAVAFLTMGQSRPAGGTGYYPVGTYQGVQGTGGVWVVETTTGDAKFVPQRDR